MNLYLLFIENMKKSTLWLVAILWLVTVLAGCNSKEAWDVDFDLKDKIGRQLHCYVQFQKENEEDNYVVDWKPESNNWFTAIVEWIAKSDDKEYALKCTYDDGGDWTIEYTPTVDEQFDLNTPEGRQAACEERAGYYLNFNEWTFVWNDESEGWASFVRNWHVTYLKWWENAEDDVECVVDMVDRLVTVEFSNHIYNGELQEERTVTDAPAAKMRVLEWETAEETMARMQEACENMWGEWTDGVCTLEDGSVVAF